MQEPEKSGVAAADCERVFCPVPWGHVSVSTSGHFLSCPIAASTEEKGIVRDSSGSVMRAGAVSVADLRNADTLKELRRNMLKGKETLSICKRCVEEEAVGLISRRALERNKGYITRTQALEVTAEDGGIDGNISPVYLFDLRLGNHCNLACRTCNPSQSSGWYEEWFHTRHKGFRDGGIRRQLALDAQGRVFLPESPYYWYQNGDFWEELLARAPGLRELHFSGGEPFFSSHHTKFLERLCERGLAREVTLDYNSNLTFLPERLTRVWENFKAVNIGVSIDGFGPWNDYVRYPSRFETLERNLDKLEALPLHVSYWATNTISALNVGGVPELVRWILRRGLSSRMNRRRQESSGTRFFSYHLLRKPELLSVQSLPLAAKQVVRGRFEAFLAEVSEDGLLALNPAEMHLVDRFIFGILSAMEHEDRHDLSGPLAEEIRRSDDFRGQSYAQLDPLLWECLMDAAKLGGRAPLR